jgi:glycosyltransferase involved in cell wall biosynthesis
VEFLGWLTDEKLSYYYNRCQALIFPGDEDFGLVMVEAQAHGAPVIAYRGGGAKEIVKEGVTGEFFDRQTPSSLIATLKRFNQKRYNRNKCKENAQRFEKSVFEVTMRKFVTKAYKEYTNNT